MLQALARHEVHELMPEFTCNRRVGTELLSNYERATFIARLEPSTRDRLYGVLEVSSVSNVSRGHGSKRIAQGWRLNGTAIVLDFDQLGEHRAIFIPMPSSGHEWQRDESRFRSRAIESL